MNTLKRKLTAILLTFAMLFSLMPALPQAAEAAIATSQSGMFSFDYQSSGNRTLNVEVKDQNGYILDSAQLNDFLATGSVATFKLNSTEYEIVSVECSDNKYSYYEYPLQSDKHQYRFSTAFTGDSATLTVYVKSYEGPAVSEFIYDESQSRSYRIYYDQIWKMLYSQNEDISVDATIESITPIWYEEFGVAGSGSGTPLRNENRVNDYYDQTYTVADSVDGENLGQVQPYNIKSLDIVYDNKDGKGTQTVSIPSSSLRFTVGEEARAKYYDIELADDSFHVVFFYNEDGANEGNNYFPYAVKFVEHGQSLGDQMPADPTYPNTEYEFVNWDQNSWKGSSRKPLLSTTIINEDVTAFARKISSSSGSTQFHVINDENNELLNRIVELYNEKNSENISVEDIDLEKLFYISVYNSDDTIWTNVAYSSNGWDHYNGINNYYYRVGNVVADEVIGAGHNAHINPADVGKIRVTFTLDTGHQSNIDINVGENVGDISVYMSNTENIIELYINQPGEVAGSDTPEEPEVTPNAPTYDQIKDLIDVKIDCTANVSHEDKTYDLIDNTTGNDSFTVGEVTGSAEAGYTVDVTVHNGPYVAKYNTDGSETHTISGASDQTVSLKYENDTWKLKDDASSATVKFEVTCTGTTPVPEQSVSKVKKDLIEVPIAGFDNANKFDYPDANGIVVIPNGGEVTLLYSITVEGSAGTEFTVTDGGAALVKSSGEGPDIQFNEQDSTFSGTIPNEGTITFYVSRTFDGEDLTDGDKGTQLVNSVEAKVTGSEDEPEKDKEKVPAEEAPALPTEGDLENLFDVKLDCISGVGHEDQTYELIYSEDMLDELIRDKDGVYTVQMTVTGADYLEQFDKASNGVAHEVSGEATQTIRLTYKDDRWTAPEKSSPIVFDVKCSGTGAYDINDFTKDLIAGDQEETEAVNAGVNVDSYLIPEEGADVVIPYNGTVTLLYKLTVTGNKTSGVDFMVTDKGAVFVKAVDNATITADNENGTFTGTVPVNSTVSFYVAKTFDAGDINENGKLVNVAAIAGTDDDEDAKVDPGVDEIEEEVGGEEGEPAGKITVAPANLTIYEGGAGGYDAVVDEYGNTVEANSSASLPHPLFKLSALGNDDVNLDNLTFTNGTNSWKVVEDGTDQTENGTSLYHFEVTEEGMDPVRVTYTDEKGNAVTSDEFDPEQVGDFNTTYTIKLYAGANEADFSNVTAIDENGARYAIDAKDQTGTLTVRAVDGTQETSVSDIVDAENADSVGVVESGEAVAIEPENDTTYTLNDTEVTVDEADSKPSLLFDGIIDDETVNRTALLEDKVDEALGGADADRQYEIKYIDLVDANNGNAWIASSEGTDIIWGYPEGTDINTEFKLTHFSGLHRDGETTGFNPEELKAIDADELENVTIKNTEEGILFHVEKANFSPYALTWETDDGSGDDYHPWYPSNPGGDGDGPDGLNTEDHFYYIVGYEDGMVKPQNNITRAEVATIFYRLLEDDVRDEYDTTVNDFSDVSADSWYNQTVSTLASMGIVKGYEDGTFRPNAPITRAEFGAIATRFFEETGATYEPGTFTDVTGSEWFAGAIMDAVNLGLIGGYEDGTVRPNNNITRAEACAIVNRTLGRVPDADHLLPDDVMKTWPDNPESAWFYADMQEATNGHEYEWITEDGNKVENWTDLLDKDWNDR